MKADSKIIAAAFFIMIIFGSYFEAPFCLATSDPSVEEKIESWSVNHPRAAAELGGWVHSNTDAAKALFKWDYKHPEQSKEFITWVVTHQGKKVDIFVEGHSEWYRFVKILDKYRASILDFLVWCRFHPKAATALMQHPRALNWAGHHLYDLKSKSSQPSDQ